MTDKELLEMAAKAAGYSLGEYHEDYFDWDWYGVSQGFHMYNYGGHIWNALLDDGDALRLAVKLDITFRTDHAYPDGDKVIQVSCVFGNTLWADQVLCEPDPYAATRRAIVRAAAEIGKAMP